MSTQLTPEIDGVAIVLVGKFNPAIFTPAWFALHGILPANAVTNAASVFIHQQVTTFETDLFILQVTGERFYAEIMQAPYIRVSDLVIRTFKDHLHHTPVTALGINRNVHFRVPSQDLRQRLGRTLAPIEPWGDQLEFDDERNGMISLRIMQDNPTDRPAGGQINITVEHSGKIGEGRTGIYVGVNDHYVPNVAPTAVESAEPCMELLENNFETSMVRSKKIIDHVMSLAAE